jgi:hypothetical protein
MVIEVSPVEAGGDAKVIGSGLGGVVSGESVVAEAGAEAVVMFWAGLLSRACTV